MNPETLAKMAAAQQTRGDRTPDTRAKLSDAIKKIWESRDRVFSPEARAKMSLAGKNRWDRVRQGKSGDSHG